MGGMTVMGEAIFTVPVRAVCFTPEHVLAYGRITNDLNPIHIDAEFAAQSRFGKPIVHGLFVMAPVWNALDQQFGAAATAGAHAKLRFISPTFVGTTPGYAIQLDHSDAAGAHYGVQVSDANGQVAIEGTILIPGLIPGLGT